MNQQSQAQSQAQIQAQLAALREQNNVLNQQLGLQAQTHIQHLQQLLPFHQSTFNPHPPQHTPSVPEPPTPVAPQSTPLSSNATFNAEEMMQQMKNTVESSMQAFVDKNQERNMNQPPAPAPSPSQVSPPIPSHPPPPEEVLPPPQHSHRRSRSRSHRHRGAPDKRPISVPRSPRRATPPRRTHRSSRPRSSHRRRHSTSRDPSRRPTRATSVNLCSSSPRRREVLPHNDDPDRDEPGHEPAILHPASWEHQSHHHDPSSHNEYYQHDYQSFDQPSSKKWKSWNQWKDYSKSQPYTHPSGWIDYPQASSKRHRHYESSYYKSSNKPLTAFSSDRSRQPPHRSGSIQSRVSTSAVPPGHVPINLQDGSREEWARHIDFALNHPDRMRAANELKGDERPVPNTSIPQDELDDAMEQLHRVDSRIPGDVCEKAVQLFSSTNLLPDYDLSTCYVRELPHTNMLALIMPLPDISRFSMPPPFGNQHNHTWALCHGTTIKTAQLILLEGKIRPANWSYHRNPQRCHLPTFGAFYLGREISNADKTFPSWAETALLDSMEKKGKGQQDVTVGAMYRGAHDHTAFRAGGNEKAQIQVGKKGVANTSEKCTVAHSNHVGLHFIALKWADLQGPTSNDKKPRDIDLGDTDSEAYNYRDNLERRRRR